MKHFLRFAALFAVLAFASTADAASRFWVGGTGTWDNADTTHWSATTGGAGGASVPAATDSVTLDGSSGGGTVTVAATINGTNTLLSITMGAFTGTLDLSANNPSLTMGFFSGTGTGARILNMGSGTLTITASGAAVNVWDMGTTTSLTFNKNTSTIAIAGQANGARGFAGGGLIYNAVTFAETSPLHKISITGTTNRFASINMTAPVNVQFPVTTTTIDNAFTINGASATSVVSIDTSSTGSAATISIASGTATFTWAAIHGMTFTGGATFTATNSFDLGGNTNIGITGPSGGGGSSGRIIGG